MFFYLRGQFPRKSALKEFLFPSGIYLFKSKPTKKLTRTKRETSKPRRIGNLVKHLRRGFLQKYLTAFRCYCPYRLNFYIQMRIQNPVEHLRWSFECHEMSFIYNYSRFYYVFCNQLVLLAQLENVNKLWSSNHTVHVKKIKMKTKSGHVTFKLTTLFIVRFSPQTMQWYH